MATPIYGEESPPDKSLATNLPETNNHAVGTELQPLVVRLVIEGRTMLHGEPAISGSSAYLAIFESFDQAVTTYSTGVIPAGEGAYPGPELDLDLAAAPSEVFVLADLGGKLTEEDAAVLERFLHAKVREVTGWESHGNLERAAVRVGDARFADLMQFGAEALRLIKHRWNLFVRVNDRQLAIPPREFETLVWDLLRNGKPVGEELVLKAFGVTALGIDMGERGFVIRAGSEIRSQLVPPGAEVISSWSEQGFFSGLLQCTADGNYIARRDLWRPNRVAAARFVAGDATADDWKPLNRSGHLRLV